MLKLLIVDDEKITRDTLLEKIDWEGLNITEVRTAKNGLDALMVCEAFEPDICLCDVKMPKMNGIQLGFALKDKFPGCRVIYLSGYCDKEDLLAAIEMGAVSYIEKPLNLTSVRDTVNKTVVAILMERREQEKFQDDQELIKKLHEQFTDEELSELIKGKANARAGSASSSSETVQKVYDYIELHLSEPELSVAQIADALFMNKSYLCTLFKKDTDTTINVYLTRRRIEEAARLIRNENLPFYEVAYRVGINDPNYFSTLFKKCMGVAPSEYRESKI